MSDTEWLVPLERRKLTPNRYHTGDAARKIAASRPDLIKEVQGLVLHYTASGNTMRSVEWLCNPASKSSAHFVVGRDGEVWQLAPLSDRTWHAGGATSKFLGERNVNGRTIGIEQVNWGVLTWDEAKQGWLTWPETERKKKGQSYALYTGDVFPDPKIKTRAWELYPDVQMVAVCGLIEQLAALYPEIAADPETRIVDHATVDPMRKNDCKEGLNWKLVRDAARSVPGKAGCTIPGE